MPFSSSMLICRRGACALQHTVCNILASWAVPLPLRCDEADGCR